MVVHFLGQSAGLSGTSLKNGKCLIIKCHQRNFVKGLVFFSVTFRLLRISSNFPNTYIQFGRNFLNHGKKFLASSRSGKRLDLIEEF